MLFRKRRFESKAYILSDAIFYHIKVGLIVNMLIFEFTNSTAC